MGEEMIRYRIQIIFYLFFIRLLKNLCVIVEFFVSPLRKSNHIFELTPVYEGIESCFFNILPHQENIFHKLFHLKICLVVCLKIFVLKLELLEDLIPSHY